MIDFDFSIPHKIVNGVPVALTEQEIFEAQKMWAENNSQNGGDEENG